MVAVKKIDYFVSLEKLD